ncbi:cardiolipin synthase [Mesosutterella sp. AGMB02718]|uniref:Cardiolipin synthase n=1 Tax=Mesosutterella faecium TaxID=2925194 RepID=A0ABT7ISC1_9BURK|nr:cardiolipin synthase [Mesosutterella sp. AGMB02718]MDL2060201.1 cardiolipin synthase [Mesosutterella sp. AGMB02718]
MSSTQEFFNRAKRRTADRGLRLLKQGRRGFWGLLFSRTGFLLVLIAVQAAFLFLLAYRLAGYATDYIFVWMAVSVPIVLALINSRMDSSAKITWLFLILVLPVLGVLLLLYTKYDIGHRKLKRSAREIVRTTRHAIRQDPGTWERLRYLHPETAGIARFLARTGCYPVYEASGVKYFPMAEPAFEDMLDRLERAKKFIYLEYFIIEEGIMWGRILEILAKKAAEGLDVRVLYDGTCEFSRLPGDYPEKLRALGIRCRVFSPACPFLTTRFNFRDHRKIMVIDGETAYTGGFNLADEYINLHCPYGVWKDAEVRITGRAVATFTLIFLQMWADEQEIDSLPDARLSSPDDPSGTGFVIPFADNPMDSYKVGESVYLSILNRAHHYVHIMTPYLILDGELETALRLASSLGIDVKIIVPGKNDNPFADALARSHYLGLLEAGVKIYEYTPGFVHSKVCTSDGGRAFVGTINLDYRSLYHHFECGVFLREADCISDIEADFQATLRQCRRITRRSVRREKTGRRLLGAVLKVIAPLM